MAGYYVDFTNNAQPPLNDTTLDNMQNLIKADIEARMTYSTTEQRIGTWIDNKPLYRRVTSFTLAATHENEQLALPHGISNLKMITDFKCTVPTGNGTGYILPFTNMSGASTSVEKYNSQYIYIDIRNDEWGAGRTFYMMMEYTKTTD